MRVQTYARSALLLAAGVSGQSTQPIDTPDPSAPAVDLGYVKYQGYSNATAGIYYFRGIQYAANPTGQLRWRKPVPIETSNTFTEASVYNATQIAPACYQAQPPSTYIDPKDSTAFLYVGQGESEDCLILDVLVPSNPTSSRLPVIVQIHGGGYTQGSAETYPGDAMVNASNGGLIYVSIQYRLGLFGFLPGAEVVENRVLNAGLLDQRAALEWILRNIAAFGGDPSRVTIWGGSAGGGSVTAQLIAGGAFDEPPFANAIAEYPWWQTLFDSSQQESLLRNTLNLANCSSIECLRSLSGKQLGQLGQVVANATYPSAGYGFGPHIFGPVVDGEFIQELPSVAFAKGHFHDVPLLVDHDAYEGVIFSNASQTSQVDETTDARYLFPTAGPAFLSRLYQLYPASDFISTFFQRQTWFGDYLINCPTYHMATNAVDRNSNSSAVFKLTFAAGNELHGATSAFLNAATTDYPFANNKTLADIMTSYWISFATTGDPNPLRSAGAPFWPSYVSGGEGTVANGESVGFETLGVTYASIERGLDRDASAQCDFFASHGYRTRSRTSRRAQ